MYVNSVLLELPELIHAALQQNTDTEHLVRELESSADGTVWVSSSRVSSSAP